MKRKRRLKSKPVYGRHYTVILEPDEGGYHAFCPALRGCHTQGDTIEEARRNIQDAIELYCESVIEDGEPLPEEKFIIFPMAVAV